jgi:hypothetical protein
MTACLRAGLWGERYRCSGCAKNPGLKAVWGCEQDSQLCGPNLPRDEDDEGNEIELARCPATMIGRTVVEFIQDYDHMQRFPNSVTLRRDEMNPLFLHAVSYYEKWFYRMQAEVRAHG